jgi:hypothetical protein
LRVYVCMCMCMCLCIRERNTHTHTQHTNYTHKLYTHTHKLHTYIHNITSTHTYNIMYLKYFTYVRCHVHIHISYYVFILPCPTPTLPRRRRYHLWKSENSQHFCNNFGSNQVTWQKDVSSVPQYAFSKDACVLSLPQHMRPQSE